MILENLQTEFIGQTFIYLKSINSTQIYAKQLDKENKIKDGTVICSDKQTAGIGTHSRKWYTGCGDNIAFTIVLYPNCKLKDFERFTYIIAETMLETLKVLYNLNLKIKIPNDIVYKDKKIRWNFNRKCFKWRNCKKDFYWNRIKYKSR